MTVADPTQSEIEVVQVGAGGGRRRWQAAAGGGGRRRQPDEQWVGTGV